MPQKSYHILGPGWPEITKTLAEPTNRRMVEILEICGVKSFKQLLSTDNILESVIVKLDLGVDRDRLQRALDVCLIEGSVGIDLDTIDLRVTDGIVQDFFDQRSMSLIERTNSSN